MASPDLERMEILKQTGEKATGAVIFLHGSGDNGAKLKSQMEEFMEATGGAIGHPFLKMYFPTAPEKHITLRDKMVTSWFDGMRTGRKVEDVDCNYDDCDNSAAFLIQLIEMIEITGIPRNRIVLAGISQGAMQAMYTAFTKVAARGIAGLIVMATVFPFVKAKMLKPPHPPLYHFHGAQDPIVPLKGVKMAESLLNFYGVKVNLQILPESTHELDEHYVKRFLNTLDNLIPRDFESS